MTRNDHIPSSGLSLTAALLALLTVGYASSPVPIVNPGFEDPPQADGGFQGTATGWSIVNAATEIGVFNVSGSDFTAEAPEGDQVGYVYGGVSDAGLSQVLAGPTGQLIENANYTLTVQVGDSKSFPYDGYRVQLLAGGTVLAEDNDTLTPATDAFVTSTVTYTYNAAQASLIGEPLEIRLLGVGKSGGAVGETEFDDVQLLASLPDPVANTGGPYTVFEAASLELDGSGSLPSDGETIMSWEWDLDNDDTFDITGANPAAITEADLMSTYGMVLGSNTIQLRVTDSAAKTSTVQTTVSIVPGLLIYEPFADLDSPLNGNTPGLGLTGNWGPGEAFVADTSLIYGALAYEGGSTVVNPNDQFAVSGVSPGTTLTDAGLLADGSTLWFSCLIVKPAKVSGSNDRRIYVSLGTGTPDGFDRIGGNGGSGLCVAVNKTSNNGVEARGWNDGSDGGGGAFSGGNDTSVADDATFLAVGKITWGTFGTPGSDVFELYLPDEDLNLGSPVSTLLADFDQDGSSDPANLFDTIGIAAGRPQNLAGQVDEIRFGSTYGSVTPRDETPPEIVSTDPVDDDPAGNSSIQSAVFDEPILLGTGDIRIVNDTDNVTTTIPMADPQIAVAGRTLTINLTTPLIGSKAYHIEIDPGAVTNTNGVDFSGLSDPTAWNFIADGSPPTLVSIENDVSPLPLLTATSVTYAVTFDEPMIAATIDTADFGNSSSASVTIDSVTPTSDPAVYEVIVSAVSAGDLILEIVANAQLEDLSGNLLDTTSPLPDSTTITVTDPTPTAASAMVDFQATIASEAHPDYPNEARYFHVSVNPNNSGTGSYAATEVNSSNPAPRFVRNYTGPVEAYAFGSGANSNLTIGMSGGPNPGIITLTTEDDTFDGFAQAQAKVWDATDPGPELATDGPGGGSETLPYTASADKNSGLWRSLGGAVGTIDISALTSGSIHIYYGAFSATPTVKVTMKDSDNIAADIVIEDAHQNGDSANRSEYYLAEIDFVTDGFYDVIEFEWLANGVDYTGNGRGLGVVVTGPDIVAADPFLDWSALDGATGVTFDGDANGDGVKDGLAFLLGAANPNVDANAAGLLPTAVENGTGGLQLTFNCLPVADRGNAKLFVQHSEDLGSWTPAPTGVEVPDADGGPTDNVTFVVDTVSEAPLNKVTATIDAGATTGTKLFGRIQATE